MQTSLKIKCTCLRPRYARSYHKLNQCVSANFCNGQLFTSRTVSFTTNNINAHCGAASKVASCVKGLNADLLRRTYENPSSPTWTRQRTNYVTAPNKRRNKQYIYRVFHNELYNGIPNVTAWRALRKCLHLKVYGWIVCTPSTVNVFVTLATQ
jgi:hypothetical protein